MELKNKRVLVTGADGFIGSHLVEQLVETGARVKTLSYYNSFNQIGHLAHLKCLPEIEVVSGDIRDSFLMNQVVKGSEVIFHLAALIAIPYSYLAPESYLETNVKGTLNVCQAAVSIGCERFIHTSTSEVYGSARYVPMDENHPLNPQSPYSASKIGADAIVQSFYYSFQLPAIIARPFNTYGPRQSQRAIIPSLISQILSGEKKIKVGNLHPTRDFNYVKDTVRGLILLAQCDTALGQVVNIGSRQEVSIQELVETLKKQTKTRFELETEAQRVRTEGSEVNRLFCENAKIKALTGYEPAYSLSTGLHETIEWFRSQSSTLNSHSRPTQFVY